MKKKSFILALVLAGFVSIAFTSENRHEGDKLSKLALSNIEALAEEITTPTECPGGTILCAFIHYPGGSVTYYKRGTPSPPQPPTPAN